MKKFVMMSALCLMMAFASCTGQKPADADYAVASDSIAMVDSTLVDSVAVDSVAL